MGEQRKVARSNYMNGYIDNLEQNDYYHQSNQNHQDNYQDYNPKHEMNNDIYQQHQQSQSQEIQVQILPQQDWDENTTAITGGFSDFNDDMTEDGRSSHYNGRPGGFYSKENKNAFVDMGDSNLTNGQSQGCFRTILSYFKNYFGFICSFCVSVCAFFTPIMFIVLPRINISQQWQVSECGLECEGILIGIAFKLFILLFGSWAIFAKKPRASLPRIYELRILLLFLMCIMTFSYWLFYGVRIIENKVQDYHNILQFTVSYVDVLLFIYIVSVFVLEIRHIKTEYVIKIVRSPDGEQLQYPIGKMSIQRAAVHLLEQYYKDFKVYNPWLENAHRKRGVQLSQLEQAAESSKKRGRNGNTSAFNNMDDYDDNQSIKTDINIVSKKKSSSRMNAGTGSVVGGNFSANDRFYEEYEYERRLRKRRARLLTSTEEAFTHIRRVQNDNGSLINGNGNSTTLMDPLEAAQAIFTSIARDLRRYLRITRQQPYFTRENIISHLAQCISYDMSPKSFLERYFSGETLIFNERAQLNSYFNQQNGLNSLNIKSCDQNWILICDSALYENLEDNLMFVLKQNEVTLMCTIKRVPRFNLIEDVLDPKRNKFILKLNSETTV